MCFNVNVMLHIVARNKKIYIYKKIKHDSQCDSPNSSVPNVHLLCGYLDTHRLRKSFRVGEYLEKLGLLSAGRRLKPGQLANDSRPTGA